ncbi:MAG: hypothetical protein Q7J82_07090 [Coriobacteriia bacterium]|nr:hypothetical protein [Coriobacteriia bacterium]
MSELFDPTPLFVAIAILVAWRWNGVSRKWFAKAGVLAAVMSLEWIAWHVRLSQTPGSTTMYGFQQQTYALAARLLSFYLAEGLLLLIACVVASTLSINGICRARKAHCANAATHA